MKARYIMVGGFLGAGKTTALIRLAERYRDRGLQVGLITNDQSDDLVDTAILRKRGFAVEEIAGGCFCCKFPSLQEASRRLTQASRPDVFLAEPVGSCTDLVATVSYPLRRIYGDDYEVAPLTVLLDPTRVGRMLGLIAGRAFSDKVRYVFEKQLEEAHVLALNKIDSIDEALAERIVGELARRYPGARRLAISAREGAGFDEWVTVLDGEALPRGPAMEIDYDRYAEGEAELGWLNATLRASAPSPFDGDAMVLALAESLRRRLLDSGVEIAHLKITLDAGLLNGELAAVSVVSSDAPAEVRDRLPQEVDGGALIVNLRAEAGPERLRRTLIDAAAEIAPPARLELDHVDCFRPARPVPTHRVATA